MPLKKLKLDDKDKINCDLRKKAFIKIPTYKNI